MSPEAEGTDIQLVRMESKIDRLYDQIKNQADLLHSQIKQGDAENAQRWMLLEQRVKDHEERMKSMTVIVEAQNVRLQASERWQAKVIGIAMGASTIGGGIGAAIVKALGT